jgi:hypothetical protein
LKDEDLPPADAAAWQSLKKMVGASPWAMTYFAPRGVGPTALDQSEKKQTQNRRRFYLLGQTLDSARAYDIFHATLAAHRLPDYQDVPLWLQSHRRMAGAALYATMFQLKGTVQRLDLYDLPKSHRDGPFFLNVNRYLDMPQAVAMAAERSKVVLYQDDDAGWEYPQAVAEKLGWDAKRIQIRRKPN